MGFFDKKNSFDKDLGELISQNLDEVTITEWNVFLNLNEAKEIKEKMGEELFLYTLTKILTTSKDRPKVNGASYLFDAFNINENDINDVALYKRVLKIYLNKPFLFTSKVDNIVKCFGNKKKVLSFFEHLDRNGYKEMDSEKMNKLLSYVYRSRMYFIDEESFYSSVIGLCDKLSPYVMEQADEDEIERIVAKEIGEARKINGYCDIDQNVLVELNDVINVSGDLRGDLKKSLEELKQQLQAYREFSTQIDKKVKNGEQVVLEDLKNKADSLINQFESTYLEMLSKQENDLSSQKDTLVASMKNSKDNYVREIKMWFENLEAQIKVAIDRVDNVGNEKINTLKELLLNEEGVASLLSEISAHKSIIEEFSKVAGTMSKNEEVSPVVMAGVNPGIAVPNIYIPNNYTSDNREILPVIRAFDTRVPYEQRREEVLAKVKLMEEQGDVFHENIEDILEMVIQGRNLFFIGPSGCGKTVTAHQVAEILELPFVDSGYVEDKYELTGFKTATGQYSDTALYDAYKYGKVFALEEFDNGDPSANVRLNKILDDNKNPSFTFPNGEEVFRNANFRFIASGNTDGTGANQLHNTRQKIEESVLQRLTPVYFNYDPKIERKILEEYPEWIEFFEVFRDATISYSKANSNDYIVDALTTRTATLVKNDLKVNKSVDKILKYEFIRSKSIDYLNHLNESLEKSKTTKSKELVKQFQTQARAIIDGGLR